MVVLISVQSIDKISNSDEPILVASFSGRW